MAEDGAVRSTGAQTIATPSSRLLAAREEPAILLVGVAERGGRGSPAVAGRGKSELHRADCQVTPGRREATDRATEKTPPVARRVRVKRWGKSPPRAWQQAWHGNPQSEQGQIGGEVRPGPLFSRG